MSVTITQLQASPWAALLDGEGVEDRNDQTCKKMEQIETLPVVALKPKVSNVVPSISEMELMVAAQTDCMMKQKVAKDVSALVAKSLGDILQWAHEIARSGVCIVIYNVEEQVLLDLLRRDMIAKNVDRHNSTSSIPVMLLTKFAELYS